MSTALEQKDADLLPGDGTCFSYNEYAEYYAKICGVYTNDQGIMVFPTKKWVNYPNSQSHSETAQYLRYVSKFANNKNVAIEIGAGPGNTMAWYIPKFKEIHAVEPNPYFTKMLKQQFGTEGHVHVHEKGIQEALKDLPMADFIGCAHVFYHIDISSWHSILDGLVEKLMPGGVLAIAMTAESGKQYEFLERMYPGHTCIKQIKSYFVDRGYNIHNEIQSSWSGPMDLCTMLKAQKFLVAEDAFPKEVFQGLTFEQKRRLDLDTFLYVTGGLKLPVDEKSKTEKYGMVFLDEVVVYQKPKDISNVI